MNENCKNQVTYRQGGNMRYVPAYTPLTTKVLQDGYSGSQQEISSRFKRFILNQQLETSRAPSAGVFEAHAQP